MSDTAIHILCIRNYGYFYPIILFTVKRIASQHVHRNPILPWPDSGPDGQCGHDWKTEIAIDTLSVA